MINVKEPVAAYACNKEDIEQSKSTYGIKISCSQYRALLEIYKYINLNYRGGGGVVNW